MHKSAKDLVADGDEKIVVDYAIETYRTLNHAQAELEVCKTFLRERATPRASREGGAVHIDGNLGKAQVVFPKPVPSVKRGVDLLAVEPHLPAEVFNALFVKRVVVSIADDFEAKLAFLPAAQKAVIQNLVEVVPSTPRVSLPK